MSEDSAVRCFWLEVINQAIYDLKAGREHKDYFYSRDFSWVCENARVSPRDVRRTNGIL